MPNGIGSGLDVPAIVDDLMKKVYERDLNKLEQKKSTLQNQQIIYQKLRTLIKGFSDSLANLDTVISNNYFTSQSTNQSVANATAGPLLTSGGTYSLQVTQLATANQIASNVLSSENQALNLTNTLNIAVGSNSLTLNINPTDTLDNIRDNINNSSNNPGVSASILKTTSNLGQDQYSLLLTSNNTGTANQLSLSGDGVAALGLSNQIQAANDAQFTIDNLYTVTRSSNNISDVLTGVTFQLNGLGTTNIVISADTSNEQTQVTNSLQAFVKAYNSIIEFLAKSQSFKDLRDSTSSVIKNNLQAAINQTIGNGPINSLLSIGIQSDKAETLTNEDGKSFVVSGKLSINNDLLTQSLQKNLPGIKSFFTSMGTNFSDNLDEKLSEVKTNNIFSRERLIDSQKQDVTQRIYREESRLKKIKESLTVKYAALDTYLSKYKKKSEDLEKLLAMTSYSRK